MTLAAGTYLEHLKAYVNSEYVVHNGVGGSVILTEKYFRPEEVKPRKREIELILPGAGLAFKLDNDEFERRKTGDKPALFHFLDDNAKPWSKRCDFVIFYVNKKSFCADCIEFKSGSIAGAAVREQLRAGVYWVKCLKKTIENYTQDTRKIKIRKFLFGDKDDPEAYLDPNRQLNADPSIRYYHFNEISGRPLAGLLNTSVQEV
ncbi:MAG: hypothetical protein E8G75_13545 [Sulfitobacter sp. SK025]|nr:MAG: hypothetical protein E8G75_13545 [Sulfitobacter sp. SK025]